MKVVTPYEITFLDPVSWRALCEDYLEAEDLRDLKRAIEDDYFFELFFGIHLFADIRVIFPSQCAIGFFYLLWCCCPAYAKDFVIVFVFHGLIRKKLIWVIRWG